MVISVLAVNSCYMGKHVEARWSTNNENMLFLVSFLHLDVIIMILYVSTYALLHICMLNSTFAVCFTVL